MQLARQTKARKARTCYVCVGMLTNLSLYAALFSETCETRGLFIAMRTGWYVQCFGIDQFSLN